MTNRREFFRLKLAIPFSFSVIESQSARVATNQVFSYQTADVSGGGLGFETHLDLKSGDTLQLNLLVPEAPVKVKARVIWSQRSKSAKNPICRGGLEFLEIDEELQDSLVGFLFRQQVEARKKTRQKVTRIKT